MVRGVIRRPIAISMMYLVVAACGFLALRNVPIELLPDTSLPRLSVAASWPGSSPEVVEAFLTAPLEGAIQQVRGVETITSQSREASTSITVTFARETDMDFARLELSERLAAVEDDLPIGSTAPRVSMYVPEEFQEQNRPVLQYTVSGPYLLEYQREYIEASIVPDLLQIDGVGAIDVNGGRARVLEIELDERRINALGLTLPQVSSAIAGMEIVREAGLVAAPNGLQFTLTIRQRAESAAEVRRLPLLTDRGRVVRVNDVARVYDTFEEPTEYYRINGEPAVGMYVRKAARTNTVAMADAVRARLDELATQMPPGMTITLDRDQSVQIRTQLTDLRNRALLSAVIVLLVLLVFLRSIRAAGIIFATVAFAVMITVNILYFSGMTLNLLTMMGLAMGFGLVVDNAIVVLENIYRRRRRGESAANAAERGTREVVMPILAATGTTVVVLIPFVYLQGDLRIYYVPLAIVVGLSLVASLFVAFTFIPSLGAKLLGAVTPHTRADEAAQFDGDDDEDRLLPAMPTQAWYVRGYGTLVRGTLRFPVTTTVFVLLLLAGSYYLFHTKVSRGQIWGGGFGQDNETRISISIALPRGEELERVDELTRFFEQRLAAMPEVDRYVSRVMDATTAQIMVYFPEELQMTDVPLMVEDQLYQYSLGYGGARVEVRGQGQRFYPGGSASPNYSIKILGYNYEKVRDIAEDIAVRLKAFSRIRDVDTNSAGGFFTRDKATELVLDIDRNRLAMHDLTTRQVVDQVAAAVRGRTSSQLVRVGGEELQFSVKLDGYRTMDMHQLNELLIPAPSGQAIRLADVASLRERDVLSVVTRENQQYQRFVSYEFRGPAKLGDRTKETVVNNTALPPGYTIEATQGWSWAVEERKQIYGVLAVSVLLVFMVTAAVFESIRQPLCVLLTVPMALIGVFAVFTFTGASFTREAYVGVIMMGGVVVNNAILLVDHVNQLRRRWGLPLREAVERGTLERVRPILMTSLTTICGLLPLVLFSETADQNIWNALAYSMIGGMSSSTLLVLTVTPALYLLFERRAERKRVAASAAAELPLEPAAQPA